MEGSHNGNSHNTSCLSLSLQIKSSKERDHQISDPLENDTGSKKDADLA